MKLVLFSVLSLIILLKSTWQIPVCNLTTAKNAVPSRIFSEQTTDGQGQNVLITRALHNKPGIFLSEFGRCYFNLLDPNFIYNSVGILGIIPWYYFVYQILKRKMFLPIGIFILAPAVPFFYFPISLITYIHKVFAIIGVVIFALKR